MIGPADTPSARATSARHADRGFSLIEVLVALGILSFVMVGVAASQGDSMQKAAEVINLTTATQLLEGVVLDLEEEYRLDGFPSNPLEARQCDLPRDFRNFDCEYDLLMLEMGADNLGSLGAEANENITGSPLMTAFCSGGPSGMEPVDPAVALANLAQNGQDLPSSIAMMAPLLDPGFQQICGLNLSKMCSNTQMITSFIPTIVEQAAASTRKLVIRLSWHGGDGDEMERSDRTLEIETYITAVPKAEDQN